jgi:hypothetical protein
MPTSQSRRAHGGHARMAQYCGCGRVVYGNGGRRHFEREDHNRISRAAWEAMHEWQGMEKGWVRR